MASFINWIVGIKPFNIVHKALLAEVFAYANSFGYLVLRRPQRTMIRYVSCKRCKALI